MIVLSHVIEPLVAFGNNLELVPVLAERWEVSPDVKTYTFFLRKGRLFHNGREMKAEDAKVSLKRMLDPKTKCPRRRQLSNIKEIEILDDYTFRCHMEKPDASLPSVLAYLTPVLGVIPKEYRNIEGGAIKHPVGNGPYKFVEWKPDRYILLERFDQYKPQPGPRPGLGGERIAYADKVKFVPIPEESVALMALLNKEIDILQYFPPKYVEKYHKEYQKRGIKLDEVTGLSWYLIYFGCDKPVTKNPKFRKACAYAIDLDLVTQAACLGHAKSNPSIIARANHYRTPYHDTWYKKDPAKARQLLKEAGYHGEELVIDTTKKYIYMYRQAVAVQSELAAVGINARLNVVEWPILLQKYFKGDYQINSFGTTPMPDPLIAYSCTRYNHFLPQSPEMQEVIDKVSRTMDFKTRQKLFERAHKIHYENVPWIIFYNYLQAHWDYVKGYETINSGYPRLWGRVVGQVALGPYSQPPGTPGRGSGRKRQLMSCLRYA